MPAWLPDREEVREAPPSAPVAPAPAALPSPVPAVAAELERPAQPTSTSSRRAAQARIEEVALESVEARVALMRDARDEATRLRAAEGLSAAAGLVAPSVQVHHHVIHDVREAHEELSRLLAAHESVDVGSREVEG